MTQMVGGQCVLVSRMQGSKTALKCTHSIALMQSEVLPVIRTQYNGRPDLGSKVHYSVNLVLGEQMANQICALNVSPDQLHSKCSQIRLFGRVVLPSLLCKMQGCA